MQDNHGRHISYLRVSITDRCDLRCTYCMAPDHEFVPREEILSLEEIERICRAFVSLGVRKIRVTGGEPLLRRGVMSVFHGLGGLVRSGDLDEMTLTTNGTTLSRHAGELAAAGVKRINVSLDTLDPARFKAITGRDALSQVMEGLAAARAAGLKVKINTVLLDARTESEVDDLLSWCGESGHDLCLIESMPIGRRGGERPPGPSLSALRDRLTWRWTLVPLGERTGGPARYFWVSETGRRLGFIAPLSANFCENCNRVRLTCEGQLRLCLGRGDSLDLREVLRSGASDHDLCGAIRGAVKGKPEAHDFGYWQKPSAPPPVGMNAIGG